MMEVITRAEAETVEFGATFASRLRAGDVVALYGDLGSGKTRFVMGACRALGVRGNVSSPTFTIVNQYAAPAGTVVHIDLYRITRRAELAELGLEEYFNGETICFIEWAEVLDDLLPHASYKVTMDHGEDQGERRIRVEQGAPNGVGVSGGHPA